ncbi:MAG: site-specific integrase [Thermoplasmata archaeon]|nr:site-specific integrase [Thermoplasmata archaeon]
MRMFLRAYGIPRWDYKLPPIPKSHKRILPYPETVNKFFNHKYSKDPYENALYQYIFFHSFLIGWRVPSEIVSMTVDSVIIESKERGSIVITETKKHSSQRTLIPEKALITSRIHKSFKNWLDHWRPKVENQYSGNALYLWPNGKPVTVRRIGQKLSEYGKKIWKHFQPYDMRHWCAVARLIKTKVETGTFDTYRVKNWLGHERITTTENYIRYAEQYYNQLPVDWIAAALKPKNVVGKRSGKKSIKEKINRTRFSVLLTNFSPVGVDGLGEI